MSRDTSCWWLCSSDMYSAGRSHRPHHPTPRVQRTWIAPTVEGVRHTLRVMGELARGDSSGPLVQRTAQLIRAKPGGLGRYPYNLREWLQIRWVETPDPYGVELVTGPEYQLARMAAGRGLYGDCDDVSTLTAALALAVGLEAQYVAVAFWPGVVPEHVWCEVSDGMSWVPVDILKPPGASPEISGEVVYRL